MSGTAYAGDHASNSTPTEFSGNEVAATGIFSTEYRKYVKAFFFYIFIKKTLNNCISSVMNIMHKKFILDLEFSYFGRIIRSNNMINKLLNCDFLSPFCIKCLTLEFPM